MARPGGINLISVSNNQNPELAGVSELLRRISYGSLIVVIISGAVVGGLFGFFTIQRDALMNTRTSLVASVNQNSTKEGLLTAVKQRAALVKKIAAAQKQLTPLFTITGQLATPEQLESLLLDDSNKAVVLVKVGSIGDAAKVVDTLMTAVAAHQAEEPQLDALSLTKDGNIELSVSFVPTL